MKFHVDSCVSLCKHVFIVLQNVELTMNLWPNVGLCNKATGIVVDIIFQNNHQPPDLPIAVVVDLENYGGPALSQDKTCCVPICPTTVSSQTEIDIHERQQLPLKVVRHEGF